MALCAWRIKLQKKLLIGSNGNNDADIMETRIYSYVQYDLKHADKMQSFISAIHHMNPSHV